MRWEEMRCPFAGCLLLVLACAACSGPPPDKQRSEPTASTAGETRATIAPRGQSAAILRSGPEVPLNLPRGFTLYPDAKVITNTVAERRGKQHTLLVFETGDPISKVLTFYRLQAGNAGARLTIDLGGHDRASLGGTLRSRGNFTLTLRRDTKTRAELAFE